MAQEFQIKQKDKNFTVDETLLVKHKDVRKL